MSKLRRNRRRPVAPAATRPAAAPQPRMPSLPHNPGTIVGMLPKAEAGDTSDQLTPEERRVLTQAGWRPGDPIPDLTQTALGKRMAAEAATIKAEASNLDNVPVAVNPTEDPKSMPEPKQITDLPPEQQEVALRMFQEMDEVKTAIDCARQRETTGTAVRITADMPASEIPPKTLKETEVAGIELVDDIGLRKTEDRIAEESEKARQLYSPDAVRARREKLKTCSCEQSKADDIRQKLADDVVEAVTATEDAKVQQAVTDADKLAYLAHILGEQPHFTREVSLFGGRILITFRTLTPAEVDTAFLQVDTDLAQKKIVNQYQYKRTFEMYRMITGISGITVGSTRVDGTILQIHNDDATTLVALKRYFDNEVFKTESVRNVVATAWKKFNADVLALEAEAANPDFFKGIA